MQLAIRLGAIRLATVMATLGLVFTACTTNDSAPAPETSQGGLVRFGMALGSTAEERLTELEADTETEVPLLRVFARWDTEFPTADQRAWLAEGRRLHLSVRPVTDDGTVIPWWKIAAAKPGSPTQQQMEAWAEIVASLGPQVYFTFNHEPETTASEANGTAEDFVSAWRRMVAVLREAGGDDIETVFVAGGGAYRSGEIERWYPGDESVDVVGADFYNWYDCQGGTRPWASPGELIEAPLRFAEERGKPLAVPEVASTEDLEDSTRKAQWITELADTLADPAVAEQIEFVAWFSVHDRGWPDCVWEHDSSAATAESFAALLKRFG